MQRGMDAISLWHCSGVMEAQVALITAFRSSALLGLVSLIFFFSMRFRSGEFAGQSSTVTPWSLNQLLYLWQCGQEPSPAGKWNQHLHKACQQKEAWRALKFPGRWLCWLDFRKDSGPTPADDMAAQIFSDCGNFTLDFKKHGFCSAPLFLQTLGSPFPEDVWVWWLLMHWLQLQFTPCEALPSVWISFAWQYSQACGHPCCLRTFSYSISSFQSTLHLICFDTALCEEPHLSVTTLCDLPSLWRVSMIVFWTTAESAVFPIIVVSISLIPTIYTVWMIIYWNSNVNILIFWDTGFLTFISCKL